MYFNSYLLLFHGIQIIFLENKNFGLYLNGQHKINKMVSFFIKNCLIIIFRLSVVKISGQYIMVSI
jgi:hypothetical protein